MGRQRAGGDPGGNRFGATLQTIKHKKPVETVADPAEDGAGDEAPKKAQEPAPKASKRRK